MCSLLNKQLLLTAYAYLFIMEQQKSQQGSEALQLQMTTPFQKLVTGPVCLMNKLTAKCRRRPQGNTSPAQKQPAKVSFQNWIDPNNNNENPLFAKVCKEQKNKQESSVGNDELLKLNRMEKAYKCMIGRAELPQNYDDLTKRKSYCTTNRDDYNEAVEMMKSSIADRVRGTADESVRNIFSTTELNIIIKQSLEEVWFSLREEDGFLFKNAVDKARPSNVGACTNCKGPLLCSDPKEVITCDVCGNDFQVVGATYGCRDEKKGCDYDVCWSCLYPRK